MLSKLLIRLALAALAVPGAAAPQAASAGRPDPLGSIVAEALRNNLSFAGARLAERRAASEQTAARLQWLPAVRVETRASHLDRVRDLGDLVNPAYAALNQLTGTPAFPTDLSLTLPQRYESHVRVSQPLFNETLRASVSLVGARHDLERNQAAAVARGLAAQVQIAWLQEASAQRLAAIYESTLALVQENVRVAERLLAAGRVTPEAVHRARADRAEILQQLDDAREQAAAAAREFNRIAGRPIDAPVETLPDSVFDRPFDLSADDAVRSALARREELRAGDAGIRAAHAAEGIATSSFLPSVAGAVDVTWQGRDWTLSPDDRSWMASLVASWDLFHGGGDVARRSAARYETERARNDRRDAAERITVEVMNAHEAARVSRAAIATAATRVEAARRTWTLVERRYEEGSASPVELVDARTSLTQAESNQVLTLYRYAIHWVDLERAAALRDLPLAQGDPK